ncbi:MAG: NAD(P)H-dependent oxidoreductase [Oscillospiraceae bacterium]|nr:NAD(P)H-dependent oxidoreductase [Oscillospiraceae bacterium]
MDSKKIGIFVGSLRRASYSLSIAKACSSLAPGELSMSFVDIGNLPIYNQDFDDEGNPPESYVQFRDEVAKLDGFLFVTPEYNRSVPAVLKNALDVGSRPYGHNVWNGKPGGIISVSPGAIGAFGANHQLRQPMVVLNVLLLQQPEAYIGRVSTLLNDKGELTDEATISYLKSYMEAFAKWIDTVS